MVKRLGELEASKNEISDAIIKEQIQSPTYTQDEYRMALTNYRKIDITQQDGKRKIIDTFINAIYVYDDHFKIVYNGNNKEETICFVMLPFVISTVLLKFILRGSTRFTKIFS